ncbi:MAG: hypothetical protein A3G24_08365 [Betaproteobacteria bacterium RIFCSPLOWO2_12_FULL_62_13]|nr:MAG: hypothetical protein A3G24_08365 [Betaproteobacteria bacterium RIFCSPLOWO2_12_FULL_62_13]
MGLWHGAWTDDIAKYINIAKDTVTLGMGMGITIPAPRIIETLDRQDLKEMRQAAREADKVIVTPQSESRDADKRRDDILRKMLNTPPQPKRATKKKR